MLVDFEKAFDSISWNFLYSVLKLLGFGPSIIKWMQTFNKNIKATIMQCGVMSSFINIEKGCRQGDPIAPYLFIICAQILNLMLKYNQSVRGIKVGNTEFRLTQFTDDTTIILDGTRSPLLAALNMLEVYGSMSGLKVNTDKTKLIWIGKKRYCKDKFDIGKCLTWGVTEFDLLGVTFAVDLDKMIDLNCSNIVNKVEKELKKWKRRYLTPIGKITVLKTLILPKFNHIFMFIPNPKIILIKELNNMFYKFIWEDKPDKIIRKQLTRGYIQGGLKMLDLTWFIKGLKISWVCWLYKNTCAPWIHLVPLFVGSVNKVLFFGSSWSFLIA